MKYSKFLSERVFKFFLYPIPSLFLLIYKQHATSENLCAKKSKEPKDTIYH
jgi:hypothetical protein